MGAHRIHRKDDNQDAIVKRFEELGARVAITTMVGNGFPDLVVGFRNKVRLIDCKKPGEGFTEKQEHFRLKWLDHYYVAEDPDDCALIMGIR